MKKISVINNVNGREYNSTFESSIKADEWKEKHISKETWGRNERWLFEEEFKWESIDDSIDSKEAIVQEAQEITVYEMDEDGEYILDDNGDRIIKEILSIPEVIKTQYKFPAEYTITEEESFNDKYWDAEDAFSKLREERDKILSSTDVTQIADYPIDSQTKNYYREYRTYLRNLPNGYDNTTIFNYNIKSYSEWKAWKYPQ